MFERDCAKNFIKLTIYFCLTIKSENNIYDFAWHYYHFLYRLAIKEFLRLFVLLSGF